MSACCWDAGSILWTVWIAATLGGFFAGALVPEPRRFGLDLVMPIFFGVMLVPLWKGPGPPCPGSWQASSLIVHALVPGYVFIIAGALAGVAAGMLIE